MDKLTPQNTTQEHMIQILLAMMQGIDVEYYDVLDCRWTTASCKTVYLEFNYRVKPHELPITREMWAMIDKKWKWATKDRDGWICFYTDKPCISAQNGCWRVDNGDWLKSILAINANSIDWQKSLTRRPEGV